MVKFKKGDMIIYGTSGVCEVKDTCVSPFAMMSEGILYYVLKPLGSNEGSMIYSPTENCKVNMRALMSKKEAELFVKKIPSIKLMKIENEKGRKDAYKAAMATGDPENHICLIKTIYQRRVDMLKLKKHLPDTDSDYERMAKHSLYSELSVSLGIPYNDVENYITEVASGE